MEGAGLIETERLLNVQELSEIIRLSVGTIHHWVSAGKIPVVRFGSRVLFRPDEVAALIQKHSCSAVGTAAKGTKKPEADLFRDGAGK
jgi:excisionase family DNA binding protein